LNFSVYRKIMMAKPDGPPDFGIDRSACPEWNDDPEKVDAILEWANASVEWSDTFVSPKRGGGEDEVVRTRRPELAYWSLVWRPGFIGFMSVREDTPKDRSRARAASALFIHLWCKRVDAAISAHCAEAYVNYYKCHFEDDDEGEEPKDGSESDGEQLG
jgi:hypothetical protein